MLQLLVRDERGTSKKPKTKHKEEHSRNSEAAVRKQAEIDHRLLQTDFPYYGGDPADDSDDNHPSNKWTAEPIIDLTSVQCYLQGGGCQGNVSGEKNSLTATAWTNTPKNRLAVPGLICSAFSNVQN
jgi:hypothetical protein